MQIPSFLLKPNWIALPSPLLFPPPSFPASLPSDAPDTFLLSLRFPPFVYPKEALLLPPSWRYCYLEGGSSSAYRADKLSSY